jgi:DNA-binding response OmpR family regulator
MNQTRSVKGVLVVEDDAMLQSLFGLMLESEGYRVFHAVDGQVGLDMLSKHVEEIDLVITDLGLPTLGGVELIGRVKAVHPSVRIIGTSGYGSRNVREMVLKAGADEFIPKPFSMPDVITVVKRLGV